VDAVAAVLKGNEALLTAKVRIGVLMVHAHRPAPFATALG
jgi:hypothetical protein